MQSNVSLVHESRTQRIARAKESFAELLEELDLWLDESREDTFCAELLNFSFRAAELAAILGFDRPPCELIHLIPQEDYLRLQDTRKQAEKTNVRIHPPFGWSTFDFGFKAPLNEALFSRTDTRLHADLHIWVSRWKRAIQRIQVPIAKPASKTLVHYMNSHEAMFFDEQRLRELAGDPATICDDMQERLFETIQFAERNGLTLEQRTLLCANEGRQHYLEFLQRREAIQAASESSCANSTIVLPPVIKEEDGRSARESRKSLCARAEKQVKQACGGVYPGFRELARALGCEKRPASLSNAIKSSKYLSARKAEYENDREAKPREQQLNDVHLDQVAQSTELDPTDALEQLIKDQEADQRNDIRMARPQARRRSA